MAASVIIKGKVTSNRHPRYRKINNLLPCRLARYGNCHRFAKPTVAPTAAQKKVDFRVNDPICVWYGVGIFASESVWPSIVAEGLLSARTAGAFEGDFVTSLALLSYNAPFADLRLVGPFTRPHPDN